MPNTMSTAERHERILTFIREYQQHYHCAPTHPEIAAATSVNVHTVPSCIRSLRLAGRLKQGGSKYHPNYEVVDK